MLARVRALVGGGIPVMGHLPSTPQSATMLKAGPGPDGEKAVRLYEDALALEAAGCFAIVPSRAGPSSPPGSRRT